jgi:SAM-dependent methyltransferase
MTQVKLPKTSNVGLAEMQREGWYNKESGEILPGVPVLPTDAVVDVGCGDGGHIKFCARQGASVTLVDLDSERLAVTEARIREIARNECRAVVSDCNPLPLEEGIADLTICTEVLEHVPDPAAFLGELVRITRPGGRLLLTVPDARSEALLAATAPKEYFEEPNHIRTFDKESFEGLVLGSGLEIRDHRFQGCYSTFHLLLTWLTIDDSDDVVTPDLAQHWAGLWKGVMQHSDGDAVRNALNSLVPKYQVIIARRP